MELGKGKFKKDQAKIYRLFFGNWVRRHYKKLCFIFLAYFSGQIIPLVTKKMYFTSLLCIDISPMLLHTLK